MFGLLVDTNDITHDGGASQTLNAGTIVTIDESIKATTMGGGVSWNADQEC